LGQADAFRILYVTLGVAMLSIRVYYQSRVLRDQRSTTVTGRSWRLIPGGLAATVSVVFSLAYILFPTAVPWSYGSYPHWLRSAGAAMLLVGLLLLWSAHHHLLVVRKSGQSLVQTGAYRMIRHSIYAAYMLSYFGVGILASSLVLTFVAGPMFAVFVALRLREEESAMVAQFGQEYRDYMAATGRFLPPLRSLVRAERK
jgi:protein-S-isoprenylcysteine O-methyltransferase Ste14